MKGCEGSETSIRKNILADALDSLLSGRVARELRASDLDPEAIARKVGREIAVVRRRRAVETRCSIRAWWVALCVRSQQIPHLNYRIALGRVEMWP